MSQRKRQSSRKSNDGDEDLRRRLKKTRKNVDSDSWKRNVIKKSIAQGKCYVNWKGKEIAARKTGPECRCKFKCFQKISEESRAVILSKFNNLGDRNIQNTYLGGLITTGNIQRHRVTTGEGKNRSCSHTYSIKLNKETVRVCRAAFASIHGISKKRVDNVSKSFSTGEVSASLSQRGKHPNRVNRLPESLIEKIDTHIRSFPRRESHYSRQKSARFYLSPDLNIKRMYELYLEKNEPESIGNAEYKPKVSYDFYFRYFKKNFNYRFGSPRSDTCKKCDTLYNKLKDTNIDEKEKEELQTQKTHHETKAATFFSDLKIKTRLCRENEEVEVLTFDYQQNLPLPKVPAGEAFYKRQLWTYNFCIHSGKTSKAHFFIYDETTARKSPNEVISFLYYYINNILPKTVKVLYLFSDNAAAQNKNMVIVQFLHLIVKSTPIQKIVHRFPEPGHSYLPCDRCFGVIEKFLKKKKRLRLFSYRVFQIYSTGIQVICYYYGKPKYDFEL